MSTAVAFEVIYYVYKNELQRNESLIYICFFQSSRAMSDDGLTAVRAYQHPVPSKYTKTPHPPTKPHPPATKKAKKKRKAHRVCSYIFFRVMLTVLNMI